MRQQRYLEALSTLRDFEIVEGTFSVKPATAPLLNATKISPGPSDISFPRVHILKSEEKGSDVSLGSRTVFEGCRGHYPLCQHYVRRFMTKELLSMQGEIRSA